MTLEAVIQENTGAIRALIAALAQCIPTPSEPIAAVVAPKARKEKPAIRVSATEVGSTPATPATPAPAATAEETAIPAAASPTPVATYDDVKRVIVKMSGLKGRDQVLAVLGQFGAAKGPDLKPEQYAEFITQADAAMAA